jgi:hypothetical protein
LKLELRHQGIEGNGQPRQFLSAGGQRQAFAHGSDGPVSARLHGTDHAFDFYSRGLGAVCERAHFIGYHRKPTPLLASTNGFNGSVERQQIKVESCRLVPIGSLH